MRCLAFVFACLVCEGYGHRVGVMAEPEHAQASRGELRIRSPLQSLAMLLALSDPAVGWQTSGFGHPRAVKNTRAVKNARADVPTMNIFKGFKDFFNSPDEIVTTDDRITPFDRWMVNRGLMPKEELMGLQTDPAPQGQDDMYVDPSKPESYFQVELAKPMGILFAENDARFGGVCINEVMAEGSANTSPIKLLEGDHLVGVETSLVRGLDFDSAVDAIQGTPGASAKLTFFRGPTKFLYGPTAPGADFYEQLLTGAMGPLGEKEAEQ
mmetsp:Transcript_147243/g.256976  ORF Transcript_147243/g.256976 Transcript_147243/m.256976 type:complete len:268 (-) Transcript_147243:54-857(-)